jgi:uncharacterized protein (DUF1330 family)
MAKGYVIVTEDVTDEAGMGVYAAKALPTILAAGANVLVVGPPDKVVEGEWHGNQTVVLEFESVQAAHDWYNSAENQESITLRHASSTSNVAIVAGFEMPGG